MFTAALFASTEEWIKRVWYINTMEYYSAIKKNETMPFAATWWASRPGILSEVETSYDIPLYVESKKI